MERIELSDAWELWSVAVLRGAGFSADDVAELALDPTVDASTFDTEERRIAEVLRTIAARADFREALTRQNPRALEQSIDGLLATDVDVRTSKVRRRERLVASYLQRYALKNDTVSFFGPVGWAQLSATDESRHTPADPPLASRTTYFEHWALDALAEVLSTNDALRIQLAPRLDARFRVDADDLVQPSGRRETLDPDLAALLRRCDGTTAASSIATALVENGNVEFEDEDEVFETLDDLAERGVVAWRLEIPPNAQHPDVELRARIELLPPSAERDEALERLQRLCDRRDELAAARGSTNVAQASKALDDAFEAITERAASRLHGKTYAGRTLTYEDCQRGDDVVLGPAFIDTLRRPLALVLTSARWFTHEIATRYDAAFTARFDDVADGPSIEYQPFWTSCADLFPATGPSISSQVADELKARWRDILAIDPTTDRVQRTAESLEPRVRRAFAAPGPGWPAAIHQSPDLMIDAPDIKAIRRGDLTIVLGELHAALNTVTSPFMVEQSPNPETIVEGRVADLPAACVAPVWSKARTRTDFFSLSPHDFDLLAGDTVSARPPAQQIRIADLRLRRTEEGLEVFAPDGRYTAPIVHFVEQHLIAEAHSRFRILDDAPYTPRVTIDRVVINRRRWVFETKALAFLKPKDRYDRFVGLQRWAEDHGLPRRCFYKLPNEPKPVYLDRHAPALVDLFESQLRRGERVSISEMLPGPDGCWLKDGAGRRYTSELRIAAVDRCRDAR